MMQHYQFDDIHVDKYGNIVGGIVGNQPWKTLVLDGHIDTVPVNEEKWSRNPYGGDIEDGKIYGRGTTDMKGAVAAMISAVGFSVRTISEILPGKSTLRASCMKSVLVLPLARSASAISQTT